MPKEIVDIIVLKAYIGGVMLRAEHHARGVGAVCLTIAGAIVWKADKIEVWQRKGNLGNALWLYVGLKRYLLSYNHTSGEIEVKEKSTQGKVLAAFTDETPMLDVKTFFMNL